MKGWRLLLVGGVVLALAVAVVASRLLAVSEVADTPEDPGAGLKVQHVMAQLLLREAGLTSRNDPLVATPAEVNAFLGQHVRLARLPVWPIRVRLGSGWIEAEGPTTVGKLLTSRTLDRILPGQVREYPLWVGLRGRVEIHGRRAELIPERAWIGRQPVAVDWLWRLLGGRPESLAWTVPRVVERVEVEPDRLTIHTRASPRGGRPGGG